MNRNSLQQYNAYLKGKTLTAKSWTTTGNTDIISDPDIRDNSFILIMNIAPSNGKWYVSAISSGTVTITSSDQETAGTNYHYLIL